MGEKKHGNVNERPWECGPEDGEKRHGNADQKMGKRDMGM